MLSGIYGPYCIMKLIYYSYYPYNDPEFKIVEDEDGNDLYNLPFRLYRAATCHTMSANINSNEEFVMACFEAMDRPDARGFNPKKSYTDGDITVYPTKDFYGATNTRDGVYAVESSHGSTRYYVISREGVIECHDWYNAVLSIYLFKAKGYSTKLINFEK